MWRSSDSSLPGFLHFLTGFGEFGIAISQFIKIKAREVLIGELPKDAGVAEFGKGAGLRTLSRRSSRVRITPPACSYFVI